ncbi:hypothetical protein P7C70_g6386, partial [Phenoliferia sp. Uapishka_3]
MANEGIFVHQKTSRDADEDEHVPESSTSSQIYVDDPTLGMAILDLWTCDPASKTLGLPKLLGKLKVSHPTWACSDRRLRKIRADLLDQDRKPTTEITGDTQAGHSFKGEMNLRNYDNGGGGSGQSIISAPWMTRYLVIGDDGREAELLPQIKLRVVTGRTFSKSEDGEWVLDVPARSVQRASMNSNVE